MPVLAAPSAPAGSPAFLRTRADILVYSIIGFCAVALWWLCARFASRLPAIAPWDFSFVEFGSCWLAAWWYVRGLVAMPAAERPGIYRHLAYFAGLAAIYVVLETRFEYLAEHQFFFNRMQHVAMHHVGPLLLALSWPGAVLKRGVPQWLQKLAANPVVRGPVRLLQQPVLAPVLFSGTFFFWLIPSVHFRAMIDPQLYTVMNWSMVIEGLLFWFLVLDPRPSPPARASFGARAAMTVAVMFPQIIGGAMVTFNPRDIYTFYNLCGRIYPELGAHYDQSVGGLIMWIPPAMMSIVALLLVLNMLRKDDDRRMAELGEPEGPVIDASAWTGMR
ncbi:MAG TPA: cytochrome c oxidase assembly protein [Pseudolabrys sp.]|nr:cytochrome c oxidase assembly protein [Pseudolabrys sp.]